MTTTTVLDETLTTTADDHDCHIVCCDDAMALCGARTTEDCDLDHKPTCVTCRVMDACGMACPVEGCQPGEVTS